MEKKLKRDTSNKMVAGVAAGLAKYFDLDVTWVRIAFALSAFFGGSGIWIYLILWIAVPEEFISPFTYTDYRVNPENSPVDNYGSSFKPKKNKNVSLIIGILLIGFGFYFLMGEFDLLPYWFKLRKLWPLVFVVIGLSILFKNTNKKNQVDITQDKEPTETDIPVNETDQPTNPENFN